jgi:hypothetical protein
MMPVIDPHSDFLSTAEYNYEEWRDALRPNWGLYTPDDPKSFSGGCNLEVSAALMHRISLIILSVASIPTVIFAWTVWTTTMRYFRLMAGQRLFRTTGL